MDEMIHIREMIPILYQWHLAKYRSVEISLFKKWVLNYTTLGFLFIGGFPSHEWNESHPWNDTHPLPMTAGHV